MLCSQDNMPATQRMNMMQPILSCDIPIGGKLDGDEPIAWPVNLYIIWLLFIFDSSANKLSKASVIHAGWGKMISRTS